MKSLKKQKLKFICLAAIAILLFGILLIKDRLLLWQLNQSGIKISQSEFDALKKEANFKPNHCSIGIEFNDNCYLMGAKGFMAPVAKPNK